MADDRLMGSGHGACPGCGALVGLKMILKALGPETILIIPACCASIYSGLFPFSAFKVSVVHTPFASAAATASGISRMLKRKNQPGIVTCWAGDGGTLDIGLQALSGACERNEDIIYICYDNEAYMNTGIQRSSATPRGTWTTTTLNKKMENKKDVDAILAAHKIPYIATINPAFPDDLSKKIFKAKRTKGTRFLHLFSPCPPGWKYDSQYSIKIARLATLSCIFPLYEIEDGENWTITFNPGENKILVSQYLKPEKEYRQERFSRLTDEDVCEIQKNVEKNWITLIQKSNIQTK